MTDPLKILGRLANKGWRRKGMWSMRNIGMGRTTFRLADDPDYHALRTAIEAQAEELVETSAALTASLKVMRGKTARIARLEASLKTVGLKHDRFDVAYEVYRGPYAVLAESEPQSHAAVKAEALREESRRWRESGRAEVERNPDIDPNKLVHFFIADQLESSADHIEREAKEES